MPQSSDTRETPAAEYLGRVLVVEDDPKIAALIRHNLARAGWEVDAAANGLQALTRIAERRPDLVITDIVMEEMDGLELIASLQRRPETASLPVIVLTSKTGDRDLLTSHELGAAVYLTKPFRPEELVALARRLRAPDLAQG